MNGTDLLKNNYDNFNTDAADNFYGQWMFKEIGLT